MTVRQETAPVFRDGNSTGFPSELGTAFKHFDVSMFLSDTGISSPLITLRSAPNLET